jgi:hypothetical protein
MKKIETPLTWTLTGLMIILLISFGLSNSSVNFNISEVSSTTNKGYNLVTDHNTQTVSSFNIKDPNMGMAAMAEGLNSLDTIPNIILELPPEGLIVYTQEALNFSRDEAIDYLQKGEKCSVTGIIEENK